MKQRKTICSLGAAAIAFMILPTICTASFQETLSDDYGIDVIGFMEVRQGWRLSDDPYQKGRSISEGRVQVNATKWVENVSFQVKGDLVGDLVEENAYGELRELNTGFSPLDFADVKVGRQTLTWGTGDLLFVNDLFPKDWESFFIGRDDEYLKAPSDAVKVALFTDWVNLDLIYTPYHNGSTYIDGSRVSYWNAFLGRTAGRDHVFNDHERNAWFDDATYALRFHKNVDGVELALYGYFGYWNTPEGIDLATGKGVYPRLSVYGASVRSAVLGGIGSLEAGYYDSREDRGGDDPFIRNSETRFLAGYERELARDFTGGFQYYLEWMSDYDDYESAGFQPTDKDEFRHVLTLRLTKLLMNQTLKLSLFTYYSPSDEDAYLRPKVSYKVTDAWAVEVGGNLFFGSSEDTFFGQFEDATNAFAAVRWNF